MAAYIALLRAVNVGGQRVSMPTLRDFVEGLGFSAVRTLLNSGNVVFGGDDRPAGELERLLELQAAADLGLATDFLVRRLDAWEAIMAANPFPDEAAGDPAHLLLVCLKAAPAPARVAALQASIAGREQVRGGGRELYVTYPDGIGESKLTLAVIERHLAARGTGRNWNTVLKLRQAAVGAADAPAKRLPH